MSESKLPTSAAIADCTQYGKDIANAAPWWLPFALRVPGAKAIFNAGNKMGLASGRGAIVIFFRHKALANKNDPIVRDLFDSWADEIDRL